jgi:hypothetical protein
LPGLSINFQGAPNSRTNKSFFKKALFQKSTTHPGFFGSRGIVFAQSNSQERRSTIIRQISQNLHSFSLEYLEFQAIHFLCRA